MCYVGNKTTGQKKVVGVVLADRDLLDSPTHDRTLNSEVSLSLSAAHLHIQHHAVLVLRSDEPGELQVESHGGPPHWYVPCRSWLDWRADCIPGGHWEHCDERWRDA
jgi:hypothetical protein